MPTVHAPGVVTLAIVQQMMGELLHFEVFRLFSVNVNLLVFARISSYFINVVEIQSGDSE